MWWARNAIGTPAVTLEALGLEGRVCQLWANKALLLAEDFTGLCTGLVLNRIFSALESIIFVDRNFVIHIEVDQSERVELPN